VVVRSLFARCASGDAISENLLGGQAHEPARNTSGPQRRRVGSTRRRC